MNLLYTSYGHNHFVNLLVFGIPISLYYVKKIRSPGSVFGLSLLIFALFLSSSKGAGILLSLYALCVVCKDCFVNKKSQTIAFALSFMVILIIFSSFRAYSSTHLETLVTNLKSSSSLESRIEYWKQAVTAFKQRPLLGWGPGTFFLLSKRFQASMDAHSWYAHNYVLQIAAETGVIGLIAHLFVFSVLFWVATGRYRKNVCVIESSNPVLHGVLLTLLYSFFEMNLDFLVIWILFWVMFGVLHAEQRTINSFPLRDVTIHKLSIYLAGIYVFVYCVICALNLISTHATQLHKKTNWYALLQAETVAELLHIQNQVRSGFTGSWYRTVDTLYKHDPSVIYETGLRKIHTKEYKEALSISRQLMVIDPKNTRGYSLFFQARNGLHDPVSVSESIKMISEKLTSKETYEKVIVGFEANTEDDSTSHLVDFDADIHATGQELLARLLYVYGLDLLSQKPDRSLYWWQLASSLDPEVSYYHVEHAAITAHIYKDTQKAISILSSCEKKIHAGVHCHEAKQQLQRNELPYPGSMQDLIQSNFVRIVR